MNRTISRLIERLTAPLQPNDRLPFGESRAALAGLQASWQVNRPQWLTQDVGTNVAQGYAIAPVVFACMTARAGAVAGATLRVYEEAQGERREATGPGGGPHPLRALLRRPNRDQSEAEWLAMTVLWMDAAGFAAIEIERSDFDRAPVGLWHLRPDRLRPILRDDAAPDWEYRVPGRGVKRINADDLIVIEGAPSLTAGGIGQALVGVALREIAVENAATDFLKLYLEHGGMPRHALVHPAEIRDQARADAIKQRWAEAYSGFRNWVSVALLHGGLDVKEIGSNLAEMAYPEIRRLTEAHICVAFRVHPLIIHSQVGLEKSTYNNYKEARLAFYEDTISPLWAGIDGALTRKLLPEFEADPERFELAFDTSAIPAMQDDLLERRTWANGALAISGITLNQYQAAVGLPGFGPAGDVLLVRAGVSAVAPAGLAGLVAAQPASSRSAANRRARRERRRRGVAAGANGKRSPRELAATAEDGKA